MSSTGFFFEQLLDLLQGNVNPVYWSQVDKDEYLQAMERSPVRATEIKHVLSAALTDRTEDREIFMKGIDHSYYYEGYQSYDTADLANSPLPTI